MNKTESRQAAQMKVDKWLAKPERSVSATLGARLLAGETLTATDAEALGVGGSLLTQAVGVLAAAGYKVDRRHLGHHVFEYSVREPLGDRAARDRAAPRAERRAAPAKTHPNLGDMLRVRLLVLDEDGEVTIQLTNGSSAWAAKITGQLGAP